MVVGVGLMLQVELEEDQCRGRAMQGSEGWTAGQ